jgi:hypothetical protein
MYDYYAYPDAEHFIGWFKSTMYEANSAFIFVKKYSEAALNRCKWDMQ